MYAATYHIRGPPWGSWSLAGSTVWWCRLPKMWPKPGRQERSRRSRCHDGGPETPPAGPRPPPPPATTAWPCGPGSPRPAACHWATPPRCLHPGGKRAREGDEQMRNSFSHSWWVFSKRRRWETRCKKTWGWREKGEKILITETDSLNSSHYTSSTSPVCDWCLTPCLNLI